MKSYIKVVIVCATILLAVSFAEATGGCNTAVTYTKAATGDGTGDNVYHIELESATSQNDETEFCYIVEREAGGNALSNLVFDVRERNCQPIVVDSRQECLSGSCPTCSGAANSGQPGSCGGCTEAIVKFDSCGGSNGAWRQRFCFTLSGEHWGTGAIRTFPKGGSANPSWLPSVCGPVGSYDHCHYPFGLKRGGCDVDVDNDFMVSLGDHHDGQLCGNGATPYGLRIDNFKKLGFRNGQHVFSMESFTDGAYIADVRGEYTADDGGNGASFKIDGILYGGLRRNRQWRDPRNCNVTMTFYGGEKINDQYVSWNSDHGATADGVMSCEGHDGVIQLVAEACRIEACDGELFFLKRNHRQSWTVQDRWGAAGWVDIVNSRTRDTRDFLFTLGHCYTRQPTPSPTPVPAPDPEEPTAAPTSEPTDAPTDMPTDYPTDAPTSEPTNRPTDAPTVAGCEVDLYAKWSAKLGDFNSVRQPPHGLRLDDLDFVDGQGRYHYSFEYNSTADVHGHYVPPTYGTNAWFRIEGTVLGGRIKNLDDGEWLNEPALCQLVYHFKNGGVRSGGEMVEWTTSTGAIVSGTLTCGATVLGLEGKHNSAGQYFFIKKNWEGSYDDQQRWGATGWVTVDGDDDHDGFRDLIFTIAECRDFDPPCLADLESPFTAVLGDHAGVTAPPHGLRIDDMTFMGQHGRWHWSFEIDNPAYPTAEVFGRYTPPTSEGEADATFTMWGKILGGTITYNIGWNMDPVYCTLNYTYTNGNLRNGGQMVEFDISNDATGSGTVLCDGHLLNLGTKENPGNQTFFITKNWDGTWDVQHRWGATGWVTVMHNLEDFRGHRDFIFTVAPCVPTGPPSRRYPGKVKASVRFANLEKRDATPSFIRDFIKDIMDVLDIPERQIQVYKVRNGGGMIIDMWLKSPCRERESCEADNLASSLELRQQLGNLVANPNSILYAPDRRVTGDLDPTFFEANEQTPSNGSDYTVAVVVGVSFVALIAVVMFVMVRRYRRMSARKPSDLEGVQRTSSGGDLLPSLFATQPSPATGSDESTSGDSTPPNVLATSSSTMRFVGIANSSMAGVSPRRDPDATGEHYMVTEMERLREVRMTMAGGAPDIADGDNANTTTNQ